MSNLISAIQNDTKTIEFKTYPAPVNVGQLAVWSSEQLVTERKAEIRKALSNIHDDWFMNLINVSEQKSYFITDCGKLQDWLANLFGLSFNDSIAVINHVWLRKEIRKQDMDAAQRS